jgi:hypothetical protein
MPTIDELVAKTNREVPDLATEADIAPNTVYRAIRLNQWPPQRRTRRALARVLGVSGDPLTSEQAVADAVGAEAAHAADGNQAGVA